MGEKSRHKTLGRPQGATAEGGRYLETSSIQLESNIGTPCKLFCSQNRESPLGDWHKREHPSRSWGTGHTTPVL